MFENNYNWAISNQALVKWRRLNDHPLWSRRNPKRYAPFYKRVKIWSKHYRNIMLNNKLGGFDIAAFLLNEWVDREGKRHLGLIDEEDPYMKLRMDDYPANINKLQLFNFKRDKVQAYERTQAAINQGLVMFPKSLNVRNEMEIEETASDGTVSLRYEKVSFDEMNSLVQIDLAKEEIVAMQKQKRPNGTIVFELSPDAKQKNMHDDRVDCVAMICNRLMELRAQEALTLEEKPHTAFKDMLEKKIAQGSKNNNTFGKAGGANPFATKYGSLGGPRFNR